MRLAAAIALSLLLAAPAAAEPLPASVVADPPQDAAHPAGMTALALPIHGVMINAVLYTAAGAGPHPTVLLLHGLPGNEQNLDLAQAARREGWNVLTLHYRGSWGSPGEYTFTHCLEDAAAALAWLRDPANDTAHRIDPSRLVVVGHSLGGFVAGYTDAHDPRLLGAALISAAPLGGMGRGLPRDAVVKVIESNILNHAGMRTLGDATAEGLADEAIANARAWDLTGYAAALAAHPLLIVTSDDGLAPADTAIAKAAAAAGGQVSQTHLATDHGYDDQRIALEATVIRWLEGLPGAPKGR
jgi:pimeloyl-ACP methyl ester carboxylesterase